MTLLSQFLVVLVWVCLHFDGQVFAATTAPPGTTTVHRRHGYRTVCYVAGWAHSRSDPVQFHPEDVNTDLCTHLIYAFVGLDKSGTIFTPDDPMDPEMYVRLTSLKREKPSLKVLLSVGGWTMGSEEFSQAVSSRGNMHAFAANAIEYLHRYNFDGLDIDWEFPGDRGSPPEDKQRFSQFLQIVHNAFSHDHAQTGRTRLLLSVAISPVPYRVNTAYELQNISHAVDFINAMTYDMHGSWEHTAGHHSTLYSPTDDKTDSIDYTIQWVLHNGIPAQKINLGLPFYGNSYHLTDPTNHELGAPIHGGGAGGPLLHAKGTLAYYEVCKLLTEHNDTITTSGRLSGSQAPYIVDGSRWTGYDDEMSIREKVDYVVQHGLGGVFIWTIDMDDFHGICGDGHYPLMNAIKQQFHQSIIG